MNSDSTVNWPAADNAAIRLHPRDNVAVARVPLVRGQQLRFGGLRVTVAEPVPFAHKVALERIEAGGAVIRFGQEIGRATKGIEPGMHVHVHNVGLKTRAGEFDFPARESPVPSPPATGPAFRGYRRPDGRIGTRNYIAVVAASSCASYAAELVARSFEREALPASVDGVAAFPHGHGCSIQEGPDTRQLRRTIAGLLDHPNVTGAVLVGLGCEVNQVSLYVEPGAWAGDRLFGLTLQGAGGTRAAVEKARSVVRKMIERAADERRVEAPATGIVLGLECGGSDALSAITCNPALGNCADRLAAAGGTVILSETTETFGAENLLVRRSRNREVAEKYLRLVEQYKNYLRPFGSDFNDNPSPGNREGGLTNILEKSLGAVAKAGTSVLMGAFDYAERVTGPGLVFMNTPGNDPVSVTGMAAGGANLVAFTTGRGSASGFPIVPVIKICSNSRTFRQMPEDMDINAGRIADGEAGVEEVGQEIFDFVLRVASGETTSSERLGHNEFVPWSIGPVL